MIFRMYSYLQNGLLNLQSNFNSEKLVKSETPLYCFAKVGLKVGENISQRHESSCARLTIKWTSKSMSKFQFWETAQKWTLSCGFTRVGIKRGQNNSSEHCKTFHAWLLIQWPSKSMIKFPFWEVRQKWTSIVQFCQGLA